MRPTYCSQRKLASLKKGRRRRENLDRYIKEEIAKTNVAATSKPATKATLHVDRGTYYSIV